MQTQTADRQMKAAIVWSSMSEHVLRTDRLVLRNWREDDRAPWAALNTDPEVMRHFPAALTREQSDAFLNRHRSLIADRGWGLWAVEVPGVAPFIGFVGLSVPGFSAGFTPCVEVGWRLDRTWWGRGYAPEGGRAALAFAFDELGETEVLSFTTTGNHSSQRVMEKLGMTRDPADDFDHPDLPHWDGRRHVLYRISAQRWRRLAR